MTPRTLTTWWLYIIVLRLLASRHVLAATYNCHGRAFIAAFATHAGTRKTQHSNSNNRRVFTTATKLAAALSRETVAIIGGGVAGLSCAAELAASGKFQPTVFDTGRLRPGGRCSSRLPLDPLAEDDATSTGTTSILRNTICDHAAQLVSFPSGFAAFDEQVQKWCSNSNDGNEQVLVEFPPRTVCDIVQGGDDGQPRRLQLRPVNHQQQRKMYHGKRGMGSIPLALLQQGQRHGVEIRQDVWVSPSNGVKYQPNNPKGRWKVQANGRQFGSFDRLIIAHNGKCADRLMSKTPAKAVHELLRVNFAPTVPKWGGKRMTLNSLYSLTVALPTTSALSHALPRETFVTGKVLDEPNLRWITCQSRKYPTNSGDKFEVWTILSSPGFAKMYKAPQEFLPADIIVNVTSLLLQAVEQALDLPDNSLEPEMLESRLQLWGAAVPLNVWVANDDNNSNKQKKNEMKSGFVYDGAYGVGVCGDWLLEPSIAGAWESGRRLAQFMVTNQDPTDVSKNGLAGAFQVSKGAIKAGIGALG